MLLDAAATNQHVPLGYPSSRQHAQLPKCSATVHDIHTASQPTQQCNVLLHSDACGCPSQPLCVTQLAVRIFDTTLRDGEQSPGATLTSKEKLDIAKQLAKLGVDIIEAGFPIASPDDFEAVRAIAMEVGNDVQVGDATAGL
jgi:hypothetical protein